MTFLTCDKCEDEYNKKTGGICRPVHRPLLSIEALISRKAECCEDNKRYFYFFLKT